MKCPRCNNKIDDNTQYCKTCGQKLENNHNDQYYYSEFYSNIYNPRVTSDEDYIKTYVGPTYENIKKEKFSLLAFILGPFYLIIKKVYTPAFLILLLTIGIYIYDQDISYIFYVIISGYIGLKGTSIYLQHALRKVEEIKISNPDKSSTEILEICKKAGKPNDTLIILLIFVVIFISALYTMYKENKNDINTIIDTNKEIKTTTYRLKELNFPVYSKFVNTATTNTYKSFQYKDDENYCHITVIVDRFSPIYKSIDDYVTKNVYINYNTDEIKDISTEENNTQYTIKYINSQSSNRYLLFKIQNNDIYYIEYTENKNYQNEYCIKSIRNFIINSNFDEQKEQ